MPRGVYPRTKYHRELCKKARLGKKLSKNHKKALREGYRKAYLEGKIKPPSFKGHKHSLKTRRKLSKSHKGICYIDRKKPPPFSKEHRTNLSNAKIGNKNSLGKIPWNKGLKGVQESKYKGKPMPWMQKERHPMWKGGISRYYPSDWDEIRKKVYQRDKYSCQGDCCKNKGKRVPLDVHHIDDNVFNNKLSNLISLCRSCHVKLHWQLRLQNHANFDRKHRVIFVHRINQILSR